MFGSDYCHMLSRNTAGDQSRVKGAVARSVATASAAVLVRPRAHAAAITATTIAIDALRDCNRVMLGTNY